MEHSEPVAGKRMTIAEHLDELRRRLVRASIALAVVFGCAWFFVDDVMVFLQKPHVRAMEALQHSLDRRLAANLLREAGHPKVDFGAGDVAQALPEDLRDVYFAKREVADPRLLATSYTAPILTYMRACLILALLLAGPYVLWEIWGFVAAGLYKREKTFMRRYFPLALVLFASGIAFGYFLMIPISLEFLAQVGSSTIRFQPTIDEYFSLFTTLTFLLGLIFQVPLVMLIFSRLGILGPDSFRGKRKYVLLGCFVLSAIATPTPDPVNQSILALSIYLLYELGILLAKIAHRDRQTHIEGTPS